MAPETYLKRLIVGGFTKVFEFAKCFRNEGLFLNIFKNLQWLKDMLHSGIMRIQ
nr:amino acid--tRNA ligase-related protein [Peribacillus simplex]